VAGWLSDNRIPSLIYDLANIANDEFVILILDQVLVLDQICDRRVDSSP